MYSEFGKDSMIRSFLNPITTHGVTPGNTVCRCSTCCCMMLVPAPCNGVRGFGNGLARRDPSPAARMTTLGGVIGPDRLSLLLGLAPDLDEPGVVLGHLGGRGLPVRIA